MKTFCLFLAVALANSVVAYFIKTESENFQWQDIETNETNITNVQGNQSEGETQTNKSHTRQLFGTKDDASASKQLVPVGTKNQQSHTHTDSSKQLQLIAKKTDEKHEQKMKGFAAISLKYGGLLGGKLMKAYPSLATKLANFKEKSNYNKAKASFNAWATANPAGAAVVKFGAGVGFAVADSVVTTLIVGFALPTVGILIGDAVIELCKAALDLQGGTGSNEQTARVAWNGLALVLAIGGIDGAGTPGADASHLAEAMGNFYYGFSGNIAGEFAATMGDNLDPKKLADEAAKTKAKAANEELKQKLTAAGKVVDVPGGKKRRVIFGIEDTGEVNIKAAIDDAKTP